MDGLYSPWYINMKDRMGREAYDRMQGLSRKANIKCFNCQGYGHYKSECPRPEPPLRCHLCAELGHELSNCRLKLCEFCFKEAHDGPCRVPCITDKATCERCLRKGHVARVCSDVWRQFHNTTERSERSSPVSVHKQTEQRRSFCSNCAMQGHFQFECRLLQPKDKPYTLLVTKYDGESKTYEPTCISESVKRDSIPYQSTLTSSLKRPRYDDQTASVDSSTTKRLRNDDEMHRIQSHSKYPVNSGLVQSSYSQIRSNIPILTLPRPPYLLNPPMAVIGSDKPLLNQTKHRDVQNYSEAAAVSHHVYAMPSQRTKDINPSSGQHMQTSRSLTQGQYSRESDVKKSSYNAKHWF